MSEHAFLNLPKFSEGPSLKIRHFVSANPVFFCIYLGDHPVQICLKLLPSLIEIVLNFRVKSGQDHGDDERLTQKNLPEHLGFLAPLIPLFSD